jgi:16S rRNA processing protein RimM
MNIKNYFSPGSFIKPHGLKGQLKVKIIPPGDEVLPLVDALFIEISGQPVPYIIEKFSLQGNLATIKLLGIENIQEAEKFRHKDILLPQELIKGFAAAFKPEDLIGFEVIDQMKGNIGKISKISGSKFQTVLHIQFGDAEILIPFSRQIVLKSDNQSKKLEIAAPEGLIDLYL